MSILSTLASASTFSNSLQSGLSSLGDIWNKFITFVKDGIAKVKDFFSDLWGLVKDDFNALYEGAIVPVMGLIGDLFTGLWELIKPIFAWLFSFVMDTLWPGFKGLMGFLGDAFNFLWETMKTVFGWLYDYWTGDLGTKFEMVVTLLGDTFSWLWNDILKPMFGWLYDFWVDTLEPVFGGTLSFLGDTFSSIWNDILKPFFGWIEDTWSNVLGPVIIPIIKLMGTQFGFLWNEILKPMFGWLGPIVSTVFGGAVDGIKSIIDWFGIAWDFVDRYFIGPLYTAFDALWGIVQPILDAVMWAFDAIMVPVKMVLNVIISIINGFMSVVVGIVRGLIHTANKIPKVNISKPDAWTNIPMLAKGGIVDKPTVAMIGEAGPEAVIPLDKLDGMKGHTFNMTFNLGGMTDRTDKRALARELGNLVQQEVARSIGGSTTRSRFG
jgi:phage-related protein